MEEYRKIPNHPHYAVSRSGEVVRILKNGNYSPLHQDYSNNYARVDLDGIKESVARLVLEAFDSPETIGMRAFHIDGDKTNNSINNLVWLSQSEVQRYSEYTPEYRRRVFGERR